MAASTTTTATAPLAPGEWKSVYSKYGAWVLGELDRWTTEGKLRPCQSAALQRIQTDLHRERIVSMPTGTGKSLIALLTPFVLQSSRTLILTPSMEVSLQLVVASSKPVGGGASIYEKLRLIKTDQSDFLPNATHIQSSADVRDGQFTTQRDLVICNVHKLRNKARGVLLRDIPKNLFDTIIVDEAHHYPADTWHAIGDHFQSRHLIFLTATPHTLICYHTCYTLGLQDAINTHIVRKLDFIEETGVEVIQCVVAKVQETLLAHDNKHKTRHKALVLVESVESANRVAKMFNGKLNACAFTAGTRDSVLVKFKDVQDCLRVLVVAGRLLEGFDYNAVSVVAILRPVKSKVMFTQFVGRALRPNTDEPQDFTAAIISHTNFEQRANYDACDVAAAADEEEEEEDYL